jgi:hypothetical protein
MSPASPGRQRTDAIRRIRQHCTAMGWQLGHTDRAISPLSDAKRISTFRRSGADCSKAAVPTSVRT